MLSTIAEIQKGQGLGSGYKWLAGLVSRVCMGVPNISGVQISRDRPSRWQFAIVRIAIWLVEHHLQSFLTIHSKPDLRYSVSFPA